VLAPNPLIPQPPRKFATRRAGKRVNAVTWKGVLKGTFPSAAEAADAMGV
jgi:hypothetical protein